MNKKRKSNRLKDYDYSQNGYYFVTICTKRKKLYFGNVKNNKILLNLLGKKIENLWLNIPKYFPNIILDKFIIMPNHIHGIVIIRDVGADSICPSNIESNVGADSIRPNNIKKKNVLNLLSRSIKSFKQVATKEIRKTNKTFEWQKSFYDHIIRDEIVLNNIYEYINNNPLKWYLDKYYPNNL